MKTIPGILEDLDKGTVTSRFLVEQALERIDKLQTKYNMVINVTRERALQQADKIDIKRRKGQKIGRLAGIPYVAKDNFLAFGAPTTAGAKILEGFTAPYQATAIELLEAQGAILVGKTNMDAFGHGGSTENSYFGPAKNPHDVSRVPGGSSGGSAAAVALSIVPFALASDTGGSIRQPASFCGVVGIKPTYGLVSRYGVVAMASSMDTIGCLAQTAKEAALVMDVIAGHDERDSTTLPDDLPLYPLPKSRRLRIGLVKEYTGEGIEPDVEARVMARVHDLTSLGHTVEEVSLPSIKLTLAIYYIVVPAEISSNLSRYDGVRFGLSAPDAAELDELYAQTRSLGFMPENKRRILVGTYVLSSGYYDAYYKKAQTARTMLINEFAHAFKRYDMLIGPVTPTTAFKIGEYSNNPLEMYLADIMTVAPSLAGLPCISVPSGLDSQGMPVGLQVIGKQKDDASLLRLALDLEHTDG